MKYHCMIALFVWLLAFPTCGSREWERWLKIRGCGCISAPVFSLQSELRNGTYSGL